MSIAFSHSLRSLQADRNRFSLVVLFLIGLLFLGWLVWFFFVPVVAITFEVIELRGAS